MILWTCIFTSAVSAVLEAVAWNKAWLDHEAQNYAARRGRGEKDEEKKKESVIQKMAELSSVKEVLQPFRNLKTACRDT